MLLRSAVAVFPRLTKIASAGVVAIMLRVWISSPQAEQAGYSVTNIVSPAADLVLRIFARKTLRIVALISSKRICVDQGLFECSSGRLDDLDWPELLADCPAMSFVFVC